MRFASPTRNAQVGPPPLPKSPPPTSPASSRKPAVYKQRHSVSDVRSVDTLESKESRFVSFSRHSLQGTQRSLLLSDQLISTLHEEPVDFTTTSTSPTVQAIVSHANTLQQQWRECTSSTLSLTQQLLQETKQLQTSISTYEEKVVEKDKAIDDITTITAGLYEYLKKLEILARVQDIPWIRPATINSLTASHSPNATPATATSSPDTQLPHDSVFRPAMRQLLTPASPAHASSTTLLRREDVYLDSNVYLADSMSSPTHDTSTPITTVPFSLNPSTPNFSFNVDLISHLQEPNGKSRRYSPTRRKQPKQGINIESSYASIPSYSSTRSLPPPPRRSAPPIPTLRHKEPHQSPDRMQRKHLSENCVAAHSTAPAATSPNHRSHEHVHSDKKSPDKTLKLNATRRMQSILDNAVRKAHTESILLPHTDAKIQSLQHKTLLKTAKERDEAAVPVSPEYESYTDDYMLETQEPQTQLSFNGTPISRHTSTSLSPLYPAINENGHDIISPEESPRDINDKDRSRSYSYEGPEEYITQTPFQTPPPQPPTLHEASHINDSIDNDVNDDVEHYDAPAFQDIDPYCNFFQAVLSEKWLGSTIRKIQGHKRLPKTITSMQKYLLRVRPEPSADYAPTDLTAPWLDDFATSLGMFWPKEERELLLELCDHFGCGNQLRWLTLLLLNQEFDPDELPPLPPSPPPPEGQHNYHTLQGTTVSYSPTESNDAVSEIGSFDEESRPRDDNNHSRRRFIGDMTKKERRGSMIRAEKGWNSHFSSQPSSVFSTYNRSDSNRINITSLKRSASSILEDESPLPQPPAEAKKMLVYMYENLKQSDVTLEAVIADLQKHYPHGFLDNQKVLKEALAYTGRPYATTSEVITIQRYLKSCRPNDELIAWSDLVRALRRYGRAIRGS